jgi:phospholipase C
VTIWLENTDYDNAFSDPNLQWLASKGISVSNYFGVTHPSMPNYIASIGGDTFGCDNDDFKQIAANVSTLVDLLEDKGISWSTYQEDMPYSGFEGKAYVNQQTKANDYVRKHHPTIIYDANTTPERLANQKNLSMTNKDASMFHKDLAEGKLPQWMFITPNMVRFPIIECCPSY